MEFDTIAAIATPMGEGGIAIIRVSGSESVPAVDKIFRGRSSLSTVDSHTIHYGHLVEPKTGNRVEEAMVSVMKAPRTYTKEDVVEVNCHGGLVSVQKVLQLVLDQDVRLAEPGEFTKRAFLNGRVDLSQAEAVIDLIRSKSDRAMDVAMQQVQGRLSRLVENLRRELIELIAHLEVMIDYPEHDVESVTHRLLVDQCSYVKKEIERLLSTSEQGKILREGLSTVIVGRPNVGKSSLLNSLVHENKAIVTEVPGTTRDVVEEYVNIKGVPLRLVDTAGIRETDDQVERIGVDRSRAFLQKADLVLFVLNSAEALTDEDRLLMEGLKDNTIVLLNKTDLPRTLDIEEVRKRLPDVDVIETSVLNDIGMEKLEDAISEMFFAGGIESEDLTYVSNTRHITLLKQAMKAVDDALEAAEMEVPIDMIAIDVRRAWELLGEIVGDAVSEDLVDQLFSQFCLGK